MNEVQEYILKRAMQKLANDQNKKIPWEYAVERRDAYNNQKPSDQIAPADTPGAGYVNTLGVLPFYDLNEEKITSLPSLRAQQARNQARELGLKPGTNAYNMMIKYLIEQGETNWHNFNNPKNPKPNIKVPHFEHDSGVDMKELNNDQVRVREAGRTMVSTDNYKKFSGNA